jgi:hypothetical protein
MSNHDETEPPLPDPQAALCGTKNIPPKRVRNTSERTGDPMNSKDDITHTSRPKTRKTALYKKVARNLSIAAKKDPPWGWRYVESVLHGTVRPGKKFMLAVNKLLRYPMVREMTPGDLLLALNNREETL